MINIKFNNCVFFLLFCSIYLYLHSVTIADYHIDSSKYSQIVSYDERTNEEYIYYISNSEVTQAEWKRIIGINNSFFQNDSTSVENVSWIECIEFCNKLSLTENLIPYYNILNDSSNFEVVYNKNSNGYRLPFSNEWIFSLGEQLVNKDSLLWDQYSWNLSNSDYNPKKPKLLKNNKYNLYDMVGNVYEWCNDNFDTDLMNKLIIGGSWKDTKNLKLSDTIFKKNYNYSDNEIGLRLVRNVPSYGSLKILCNEPNINVEIYNNFNKIIVNDTLSDYNLICGNYNIIVYKDGFLKYFKNIEIKNSSLFLLKVVLKKGGTHNKNFVVVNRGNYDLNDQVVSINDLFVSKYETTQNEWKEIMNSNPSFFKGDSLPVENITFLEAIQFCNKKSKKNGFDECYKITEDKIFLDTTKNGYRLPTTIEWNYLVSGGKYQDHFIYSGSNNIEEVAWYIHNSNNSTHKVGKKIPNILGIYDMSGNVWEMCWDMSNDNLNNYYFSADKYDNYTSIKGGSWFYRSEYCNIISDGLENEKSFKTGFRIVATYISKNDFTYGELLINNMEKGLNMFLIDSSNKKHILNDTYTSIILPEGEYKLYAQKPNFKTFSKKLYISQNTTKVFFEFEIGEDIPEGFINVKNGTYKNENLKVNLSSYLISKNQITIKEWSDVSNISIESNINSNLPKADLSWLEAVEFCNKKSIIDNLKPCYIINGLLIECDWEANGYRLPTVSEWEYVALLSDNNLIEDQFGDRVECFDKRIEFYDYCWDKPDNNPIDNEIIEVTNPRGGNSGNKRTICGNDITLSKNSYFQSRDYCIPNIKNFIPVGVRLVRKVDE